MTEWSQVRIALKLGNSVYPTLQVLSEETLKAVGPFYLVSVPGEVKDPTSLHTGSKCEMCRGLHNSEINHSGVDHRMGSLEYT